MSMDSIRQGIGSIWESVTEGWERLRRSASDALTRYSPGDKTRLPAHDSIDDALYLPSHGWAMLGGDVYEDDDRIVVRIEAPGMEKDDFEIDAVGERLVIRGEKRFEHESTEGRWRILQCAYGSFHRNVTLPAPVRVEQAKASYRNGVLRIELPKAEPGKPRTLRIKVA